MHSRHGECHVAVIYGHVNRNDEVKGIGDKTDDLLLWF